MENSKLCIYGNKLNIKIRNIQNFFDLLKIKIIKSKLLQLMPVLSNKLPKLGPHIDLTFEDKNETNRTVMKDPIGIWSDQLKWGGFNDIKFMVGWYSNI